MVAVVVLHQAEAQALAVVEEGRQVVVQVLAVVGAALHLVVVA